MTDRLTDDEIRALLAGATPGPWVQGSGWIGRTDPEFECLMTYGICMNDIGTDADAELMAAAPALAREVLELRARVAELEAERWPIPGTEGDEQYTARALLGRVVDREANLAKVSGLYACMWRGIRGRTGLESTYSQGLCRAYGFDPDTGEALDDDGGAE